MQIRKAVDKSTCHVSISFLFSFILSSSESPSQTLQLQPPIAEWKHQQHTVSNNSKTMGCIPSRPSKSRSFNDQKNSFHHGPKYPQVPPGQMPQDCETCTAVNRRFQQRCSDGCTATRRTNLRPKWNPNNYPTRHSWEIYDLETPW